MYAASSPAASFVPSEEEATQFHLRASPRAIHVGPGAPVCDALGVPAGDALARALALAPALAPAVPEGDAEPGGGVGAPEAVPEPERDAEGGGTPDAEGVPVRARALPDADALPLDTLVGEPVGDAGGDALPRADALALADGPGRQISPPPSARHEGRKPAAHVPGAGDAAGDAAAAPALALAAAPTLLLALGVAPPAVGAAVAAAAVAATTMRPKLAPRSVTL